MAVSKRKNIVQKEKPRERYMGQKENPENYYPQNPAWNFHTCDDTMWTFSESNAGKCFWSEILPRLKEWETQTWNDILIVAKKNNHSIDCLSLNPIAQKRLTEKMIELESIVSLRLTGTHRIYGYMDGRVFNILWFDANHGDNPDCVCRSYMKHT